MQLNWCAAVHQSRTEDSKDQRHVSQALFFRFRYLLKVLKVKVPSQHTTPFSHVHSALCLCPCSSSWQAAASCWWRPCCLRTDEGPSWLRCSPSTCWCKRRARSARRPSTPTYSTSPASAMFRCAGPASPMTPSWPSNKLRLTPRRSEVKKVELLLGRVGRGHKYISQSQHTRISSLCCGKPSNILDIVSTDILSLRLLLDNVFD